MAKDVKVNEQIPPSLDLAFDWVKGVLEDQLHDADLLAGKATIIFAIATAVIGFTFPLAFSQSANAELSCFGILALVTYGLLTVLAMFTIWVRGFITLRLPSKIREEYWDLAPEIFKDQILTHMEDAFEENQKKLEWKGYALHCIIVATGLEVLFITLFLLVTF